MPTKTINITVPIFVLRKARALKRKNKDDPAFNISRQFVQAWRAMYDSEKPEGVKDELQS